jgi:thiamine-phosphate pyrophosphorylase
LINDITDTLPRRTIALVMCYITCLSCLFPSVTKPNAPQCHLNVVAQARQILDIPIVGIGGIDFDNQQQAFDAGCSAVAMIAALVDR